MAAFGAAPGMWKDTRVLKNLDLHKLDNGAYQVIYGIGDGRKTHVGTFDEIMDAIKVAVVTARIES